MGHNKMIQKKIFLKNQILNQKKDYTLQTFLMIKRLNLLRQIPKNKLKKQTNNRHCRKHINLEIKLMINNQVMKIMIAKRNLNEK